MKMMIKRQQNGFRFLLTGLMLLVLIVAGCSMPGSGNEADTVQVSAEDERALLATATAKQVACGEGHSMVLMSDGTLWATGDNQFGQLGTGDWTNRNTFTQVLSGVKAVACGWTDTLVLKTDGTVWGAGENIHGELGTGNRWETGSFTQAKKEDGTPITSVVSIAICGYHSLVVRSTGSLYAAGHNGYGEIGLGDIDWVEKFTKVTNMSNIKSVACGKFFSLALDKSNNLYGTGEKPPIGAGDGSQNRFSKVRSSVKSMACGEYFSMAVGTNNTIYATGNNDVGQFGNGTNTSTNSFIQVKTLMSPVACGEWHSLALRYGTGSLYTAGFNGYGQLGLGHTENVSTFTKVIDSGVTSIAGGYYHSLAVKGGKLYGSGSGAAIGNKYVNSTIFIPITIGS
ncbi:MAG: hypothetical protein EHM28_04985 [Spirochaetaceae bacterium]|nr:MAG: hypothetical protein EHM28_04985 [Spirochaetaceae bacterium]